MPHFMVHYLDAPGSAEPRAAHRDAHIAYRRALGTALVLAGPIFDDFDGTPALGSVVILEAESKAAASAIAARDPYAVAGIFQSITVQAYRIMVLHPPAA